MSKVENESKKNMKILIFVFFLDSFSTLDNPPYTTVTGFWTLDNPPYTTVTVLLFPGSNPRYTRHRQRTDFALPMPCVSARGKKTRWYLRRGTAKPVENGFSSWDPLPTGITFKSSQIQRWKCLARSNNISSNNSKCPCAIGFVAGHFKGCPL